MNINRSTDILGDNDCKRTQRRDKFTVAQCAIECWETADTVSRINKILDLIEPDYDKYLTAISLLGYAYNACFDGNEIYRHGDTGRGLIFGSCGVVFNHPLTACELK